MKIFDCDGPDARGHNDYTAKSMLSIVHIFFFGLRHNLQ